MGNRGSDEVLDIFITRLIGLFGAEYLKLSRLKELTKQEGLTGLVLEIFKNVQL